MEEAYREYLQGLQAYDNSGWQLKAGGGVATVALLALSGPLLPLLLALRLQQQAGAKGGQLSPVWVAMWFNSAIRACWGLHDALLAPVFGSGAENGAGSSGAAQD